MELTGGRTHLGGLPLARMAVRAPLYARVIYRMSDEDFEVYCRERRSMKSRAL
jgi:hypothetical protein